MSDARDESGTAGTSGTRVQERLWRLLSFRSIRSKITFHLLLVSSIPILFLSFIAFHTSKEEIRQEILGHLRGVVSLKRDSINRWYAERRTQALIVRQDPDLMENSVAVLEIAFAERRTIPAYTSIDRHLQAYVGPEGPFIEIFLMNLRGQIVHSTDAAQEGKYKNNRDYFREGLKDLYIHDMYHSTTLGRLATTIGVPVRKDDKPVGVFAFRLRVEQLATIMSADAGLPPEGNMYLVNNYNYFVTDPWGEQGYATLRSNYSEPVQRCLKGQHEGAGDFVSYKKEDVLAAYKYLPDDRLCIIGELPTAIAYQSVNRLGYFMILLTASTLLAATILAVVLSASISRPIGDLTELTAQAAAGDLGQRIELEQQDELGTLATSFNTMIARLQQRTGELSRSNADLQEFAYIVSHDLKEPLRSVTGFLQLLEKRYSDKLDAKAHDYIDRACSGAKRMHRLIDDLLSYSRVSTKSHTQEQVDVNEVLQEVCAALSTSIRESGAHIDVDPLPVLKAEPTLLSALFQNLISNAIKFRREDSPEIRIRAEREPEHGGWLFVVEDNGIGIESKHAERVFQVFERLHSSTKYPGTGIGLAVCKKIVERHGGRIWLESTLGVGTRFYFTLAA